MTDMQGSPRAHPVSGGCRALAELMEFLSPGKGMPSCCIIHCGALRGTWLLVV